MFRAIYDFKAPYENTLSFSENDLFIALKKSNKDHDWVHVINLKGVNGYAPVNYLTPADCTKNEEIQHIQQLISLLSKNHMGHTPVVANLIELQKKIEAELQETAAAQLYNVCSIIQQNTGCNFQDAKSACWETLRFLHETVLPTQNCFERMLQTDIEEIPLDIRQSYGNMANCLKSVTTIILEEASDQETVVPDETWKDLLDLVKRADPVLCVNAFEERDCALLIKLIQRLQSEANWKRRNLILPTLQRSLQLSPKFKNVALNSVLPEELSRDMIITCSMAKRPKERIVWSVRVLALALCASERLSYSHQQELGECLIDPLLNILETDSKTEDDDDPSNCEALGDIVKLILALYRQFSVCLPGSNPILSSVAKRSNCDFLIERIILLYNREVNPLKEDLCDADEPDVVCRLLKGFFSKAEIVRMFYTGDTNVVLDIILRQLSDYGSGEKRRSEALDLYHVIRKNSSHSYKTEAFAKLFKFMLEEPHSGNCAAQKEFENDYLKVVKLCHEFPELLRK